MNATLIVIGVLVFIALLVFYVFAIFNKLVTLKNRFKNAFAQIEVQLKRRYDLIPNLVETAKGYIKHERQTLESVVAARNEASGVLSDAAADPGDAESMKRLVGAEGRLSGALLNMRMVMEAYPDLKASQNMMQLSEELTSTENKVSFARQSLQRPGDGLQHLQAVVPAGFLRRDVRPRAGRGVAAIRRQRRHTGRAESRVLSAVIHSQTMNFFESQDRARKSTGLLVGLFVLAVVSLIVMANLLVMLVFGYIDREQLRDGETLLRQMDWQTFAAVSAGVGVVVLAGSLYRMLVLSAGGKAVAESLGGQLIARDTRDMDQRKLLNVVEEMAIASGTPAPPVYLLAEEPGINAFAAGFSPRDAVIGVTRGAVDHLSRDELQGVIAHEFSHIFNGDMRLNIRLMGVLYGILVLGILGYYLLYSASFSRRRRGGERGAGGILALAIGLIAIGFAGTFFGGLIKAAVSRQREYLADASAVQFTRNPEGLAGALKRIGGLESGSKVGNPGAAEVSHAFFARAISGFTQWLSATHPPLAERILRIDPHWDSKFDFSDRAEPAQEAQAGEPESSARQAFAEKAAAGAAVAGVMTAIDQIGNPRREAVDHARTLLSDLPAVIKEGAREPYGARAVLYALALDKGQEVRARQLKRLHDHADPDVYALTLKLLPQTDVLDVKYRLPVIDIAVPALKQLSLSQYRSFRANLVALVEMDARVDLLEWSLQKIVFNHLDAQFFKAARPKTRYSDPMQLKKEIELVLSVTAHAGARNQGGAEEAFAAAVEALGLGELALLATSQIRVSDLDSAFGKLEELQPLAKSRLLKACAASVGHDQRASAVEVELLRAFAGALDWPMPPRTG